MHHSKAFGPRVYAYMWTWCKAPPGQRRGRRICINIRHSEVDQLRSLYNSVLKGFGKMRETAVINGSRSACGVCRARAVDHSRFLIFPMDLNGDVARGGGRVMINRQTEMQSTRVF